MARLDRTPCSQPADARWTGDENSGQIVHRGTQWGLLKGTVKHPVSLKLSAPDHCPESMVLLSGLTFSSILEPQLLLDDSSFFDLSLMRQRRLPS